VRGTLATLALLLGAGISAHAQVPLPTLDARVTDLTGTLTAGQQASLEEKLAALETRKGAQVAVLILPTTQPEDIAQFGIRLAEAWKIGRTAADDGAILIVAKDDRTLRIEVGHGLEGALTDITSSRIINETIVPLFKQGDFYGGVNAGLDQMLRVIEGEPLPEPDRAWKPVQKLGDKLPLLVFVAFAILGGLRRFVGRLPASVFAGIAGGGIAWWMTSKLLLALVIGAGVFFLALVFGFGSTHVPRRGGRVFRDLGGGWGGFGRGGGFGGGGGFSGGGGSFGGGGASGRW
jgi:uncharacterized protein